MNEQQPQPPYYPPPYQEEDEITLKELILKIQEYAREVLRLWWVVVLITVPIVGYMLWDAYKTPIKYPATLTFMLDENEGGGSLGGVSAILGQFGLRGGRGNKFNLEKMLALAKSRRIVQMALFESIKVNGQEDYIANHIIQEYDYHERWAEDTTGMKDFVFSHDSISVFSRRENRILKMLHGKVIGGEKAGGLIRFNIDEDTGIMSLTASTTHEDLSIQFSKILYNKLSDFYVNKSVERQTATFNIIKSKTDSLQTALNSVQSRLLRFQDANRGLTLLRYEAEKIRLQQEIQKLIIAYGESYKQLEIADFSLRDGTPFVQVIDWPIEPLQKNTKSIIKNILLSIIIGTFLSLFLILVKKTYETIKKIETI